jgi:hypothetical protein
MLRESLTFRFCLRLGFAAALTLLAGCQPVRDEIFAVELPIPVGTSGTAGGSVGAGPTSGTGGAAGAAGRASAAGRGEPVDAGIDIDEDATFIWTETPPGGNGTCEAGTFVGSFSCDIPSFLSTIEVQRVEGSLLLTFDGDPGEAQVLVMHEGQLQAFDESTRSSFLTAPVTGMLSCSTRVMNADVQPTQSEVIPIERQVAWGLPLMAQTTVSGVMRGNFDPRHLTIEGDLTLMLETVPCTGTFNVQATRQ